VTITDIARMAQVSPGTVSRVVNNQEGVGAVTRERVLELIQEHGYQASFFAQNLASGTALALGIVFPLRASELVIHPVFPELIGAVGDAAGAAGYSLSLLSGPPSGRDDRVMSEVSRGRIDGLLLPDVREGDELVDQLVEREFPVVVVGHRDDRVAWVDSDHDEAVFELTSQLIEAGRERVALINGPESLSACVLRAEGFWRAHEERGLVVDQQLVASGPFTAEFGMAALEPLLQQTSAPSAIVAGSDLIAAGCIEALRKHGLRVPDDVAVTGFDDQPLAGHVQPPLTTVRVPISDMGRTATDMLLRLVGGERVRPRSLVLPSEIVVRESSGTGERLIF
jgi:LacI family transcriptional regulator